MPVYSVICRLYGSFMCVYVLNWRSCREKMQISLEERKILCKTTQQRFTSQQQHKQQPKVNQLSMKDTNDRKQFRFTSTSTHTHSIPFCEVYLMALLLTLLCCAFPLLLLPFLLIVLSHSGLCCCSVECSAHKNLYSEYIVESIYINRNLLYGDCKICAHSFALHPK